MSSPPSSPPNPSSPTEGRRRMSTHPINTTSSPTRAFDDAQLAQDIDAARQMSRARANSTSRPQPHPASSPRTIVSPSSARGLHSDNAEQATGSVNDYLGVSSSVAHASAQQPSAAQIGGGGSGSFSPTFPHRAAHHASHPAARFYMQHQRHGSNTSIDSASHFIDHRSQQGITVPASQISPTSMYNRGSMRRLSSGRNDPVHALGASYRHAQGAMGAYHSSALEDDLGSPRAETAMHPSVGSGPYAHRSGSQTMRSSSTQQSNTSGGGTAAGQIRRAERLVDIDDETNDYERNQGQGDAAQSRSYDDRKSPVLNAPHTPSRRPSLAEQDVCFPMHTPALEGQPPTIDVPANEGGAGDPLNHFVPMHLHHSDDHQPTDHQALPPGFPWTFDLESLEEYAGQERKRAHEEAAASSSSAWGLRNRSGAATIASSRDIKRLVNKDDQAGIRSTMASGISPDSDDATFYSRRPKKFMNLQASGASDGKPSGRYQRKLALFEGAGSSPPPIGARGSTAGGGILGRGPLMEEELSRQRLNATKRSGEFAAADTNTPLLGGTQSKLHSYHGGRLSHYPDGASDDDEQIEPPSMSPSAPPPHVPRSLSVGADLSNLVKRAKGTPKPVRHAHRRRESQTNEKQFRFTFYSNALPNTIHARHLFELPAPGQTFEELLMGISPQMKQDRQANEFGAMGQGSEEKHEENANGNLHRPNDESTSVNGTTAQGARSSMSGIAQNRSISALTSALASGRQEGSTAPNTGSNTPETVSNARLSAANATNFGQQGRPSGGGAASGTTAAAASLPAASIEKARALPGGGFRVDQDPETCTWWLDVLCPTDQEMKTLSRAFGIHPLTTEDILMEETREKIELFRNYYLVCFRSFDQDPYSPTYLEPLNMYVIVFREGTLSFHFRATPHPQNVRRRIKQLKDYINVTSDWISYALIDDITDAFGPLIQSIEYEVDSIDELVLILKEAEQSDMLRRIGTCRKKVMGLLRLMGNKADVVKGLAKRCNENWSVAPKSDIGLYLSDIQDHLITMTQNLNHYEKILSRSHSNYLAQISIEMTDANNQINDVLSKLTALGTVIVPLNVITGLWGMNVQVPGQNDMDSLNWFFGILGVMIALAVIGYFATIRYLNR